jgi:hypothetical protein
MYEIIEKEVVRANISTIPYMYIRSKQNKSLCIMLPGLGYTTLQPLFHYATNVLADNGVDILHINYNFVKNDNFSQLTKTEQEQWMYEDVRVVVNEVLKETEYEQCFLLCKSIGTLPMHLNGKKEILSKIHLEYG